ncbi:glycosyltransferase family 2 protein [Aequorivita sp. SDUM287046]|uniref:Glycosyltransferase family 2 protein n=1 Tax=Aequorivita aurantiaca TaxID=3053356 RepID=A0ABT8DIR2_9FLAO|nr:glycosyltransferase family 2 protein [Aequorivita aurantiaca]MDN3725280.1 glycosyltransferase family 2 protein [Aequorivita aurantiaca]
MDIPLVSVCMITYNHEKYIAEAIHGVLMQKTDFKIEFIIANDASTDETHTLIDQLAIDTNKITINYINHPANIGMMSNFVFALEQCRGKYIALCEGDDYWTDPLKLQKQVGFLETNDDYSICWTNYHILVDKQLVVPKWNEQYKNTNCFEVDFNNFGSPYCTYTLTAMFRRDGIKNIELIKYRFLKDNTIYSICLKDGKGKLLNFFGSVYRVHSSGIYSSASLYNQAYSNYTNLSEILKIIPESRVPNMFNKKKIWKKEFFKQLNKSNKSNIEKLFIKYKLIVNSII